MANRFSMKVFDRKRNAIYLSRRLGKRLARQSPEVAQGYREGKTLNELAEEYIPSIFNISIGVGRNAVYYALDDLLSSDERAVISKAHTVEGSRKVGSVMGKIMGKKNYENGLGIARLTSEQLHAQGRRSAVARGFALYDSEKRDSEFGKVFEREYILSLRKEGLVWREVVEKTNQLFGNNRSIGAVGSQYWKKWSKGIF